MEKMLRFENVDYNKTGHKTNPVTIDVKLKPGKDGPTLSICGNIGGGSCGQNIDEIAQLFPDNKLVQRIKEVWEVWHLNDMNAGCQHQRALGWKDKRINPTELPSSRANRDENGILAIWIYPNEHKDGLLCKPCPTCGYKYGSKWLHEPLPEEIIKEVEGWFESGPVATMSGHDAQGYEFLERTGTIFKAEFIEHGKHFDGDKESRDIYMITLARNGRSYRFRFGQSINASGKYIMDITITDKGRQYDKGEHLHNPPRLFGWGKTHSKNKDFKAPGPYDVLVCLTKYDPGDFKNFCADYGYNTDSKSAEKTYQAVKDEFRNLERLYNSEELEQLQEIA